MIESKKSVLDELSNDKYRFLVENTLDILFSVDREGIIRYISPQICRYGFDQKEILSHPFINFIHPDDKDSVLMSFGQTMSGNKLKGIEFRFIDPSGNSHWVDELSGVQYGEGGSVTGITGILRDVTDRKETELKLYNKEKTLSSIMDTIQVGILVVDAQTHCIVNTNKMASELIGLPDTDIIGKVCHKFICFSEVGQCPITDLNEEINNSERQLLTASGSVIPILKGVTRIELNGNPYLIESFIDLSDRKKKEKELELYRHNLEELVEQRTDKLSEVNTVLENEIIGHKNLEAELLESKEQFHSVIESAYDAVVVADYLGHITYWNKRAELMFGYSKEEIFGKNLKVLMPKRYKQRHEDAFKISKTVGRTVQVEALKADGSEVPIELSVSSWDSKNGRYYSGVLRDITKRKKDEEMLKKYATDLEHSNDVKNIFTDIMRHDLLGPVNIIKGYTDVLESTESDPSRLDKFSKITEMSSRLTFMIQEASKFSRLDEAENIEFKNINLVWILTAAVSYVKPQADKKNIMFNLEFEGDFFVKADQMIEDVFVNIFSNAVKYSPAGSQVIVEILDEGNNWKINIIDFGEGIEDENKAVVFDRFKRVSKGNIKGTGLGLAIVKRIVELHDGNVGVEDNPAGRGSVFCVLLKKGDN